MNYTKTEKTVKKHNKQKVIYNAKTYLRAKYGIVFVNMAPLYHYGDNVLFTTEELNLLVEDVIYETLLWEESRI